MFTKIFSIARTIFFSQKDRTILVTKHHMSFVHILWEGQNIWNNLPFYLTLLSKDRPWFSMGPFKYYVIIGLGGWVQKMAIFANYQYKESGWVRKSPKTCSRNIWMVPIWNFEREWSREDFSSVGLIQIKIHFYPWNDDTPFSPIFEG